MENNSIFYFILDLIKNDYFHEKYQLQIVENLFDMIDDENKTDDAIFLASVIADREKVSELGLYFIGSLWTRTLEKAKEVYPIQYKLFVKFKKEIEEYYLEANKKLDKNTSLTVFYPIED